MRDQKRLADPVDWISTEFYIPELRGPMQLYPHQAAVLREAYKKLPNGRFKYNTVVWSDIKKSAKSSIAAAVALHRAHMYSWATVRLVANDLKQAQSRVSMYLQRAIKLNGRFASYKVVNNRVTLPNETLVEAIPLDPSGEAGGNDHLVVFSELWAARHKAALQMWTEMTLSPTLFGYAQRWVETYAGYVGESPILEQLYERGVRSGRKLNLSYTDRNGRFHDLKDLAVYANGGLLVLWNGKPRLPWQTPEYYESERETLQDEEFDRIHRNLWVMSLARFIDEDTWDNCEVENMPVFAADYPITLALDAAVSGDFFAMVGVSELNGRFYVRYIGLWQPPAGGKIDFLGTELEPGPERDLVMLAKFYNVSEIRYDPYQLHDMATRLARGVYVSESGHIAESTNGRLQKHNMVVFNQGTKRLLSDKQLFDKLRGGLICHDGDQDLRTHALNANRKSDNDGRKLRIVKRNKNLKIDLVVALSMAAYEETEEEENKQETAVLPARIVTREALLNG